jgi:hypothetical protein
MDEKKRNRRQSSRRYALNIHGQELPEPFGVIISVIKKRILLPFQANISLVTELYVMKWITELQAVSMTLLSFQVTTWEPLPLKMLLTSIQLLSQQFPSRHRECIICFVILKETGESRDRENLIKINQQVSNQIGPIAKLDKFNLCLVYLKHVQAKLCVESCVK